MSDTDERSVQPPSGEVSPEETVDPGRRQWLKAAGGGLAGAILAAGLNPREAEASDSDLDLGAIFSGIIGSWDGRVTPDPGAPPPPFRNMWSFIPGGIVIDTRDELFSADTPLGPILETPGHGAWRRTGIRRYVAVWVTYWEGAPNRPDQPQGPPQFFSEAFARARIRWDFVHTASDQLSGRFQFELRLVANPNVLLSSFGGSVLADRIRI